MLRSFFAATLTAAVALLGCSSEPHSVDQQSTSGALRDRRAEGCEIFVDRAIATTGSHALHRITLYVKTRNGDLDGPIDHVAFHRRADVTGCNSNDCDRERPWQDIRLQNFVGAADYFELPLFIGSDYSPGYDFEGAFYVETKNGTRYWANTDDGGNFRINYEMQQNLTRVNGLPQYSADPQRAVVTATNFPYLNPHGCS